MVYGEFAEVYAQGSYTNHSEQMAEIFPSLLSEYDVGAQSVLDLACGEGSFARKTSEEGFYVKGVDLSEELIDLAQKRSDGANVDFEVADMRDFSESDFDVVTCWYDSLNYLKTVEQLELAFNNIRNALKDRGVFIFDINTFYWLSKGWPELGCYVAQDNENVFEVHRPSFNEGSQIFELKITGFKNKSKTWEKFEEVHQEKAYKIQEVTEILENSGFEVLDVFGDLEARRDLSNADKRAWFITQVR